MGTAHSAHTTRGTAVNVRRCVGVVIGLLAWSSAHAAFVESQCEALWGKAAWQPVQGPHLAAVPLLARPPKGVPLLDPVYRSCVVRVTEHDREPPKGFARNDYSRRQAFNAGGTRLLVEAQDGRWHLYDAVTLQHVRVLDELAGDAEPQWHPTDPDKLYFLPNNGVGMKLYRLDVRTGVREIAADLAPMVKAIWPNAMTAWTRSEGSPAADARYWAFQVEDAQWRGLGMFTFDLQAGRLVASYDFAAHGRGRPDHLSMSPSGQYVVVSWNDGPVTFTRDLTQPRALQKKGEHSDIALDAAGDDVYVAVDYEARGGPLFMINLRTGVRTNLFDTYVKGTATALHVSGKAYGRPGWVLVSTYADYGREGQQWLHRKVFAVELAARPRVVSLAHHHSTYAKYWTEPHATVNRDFSRVMFNSNWGTQSETDVDAYMIVLPRGWMDALR